MIIAVIWAIDRIRVGKKYPIDVSKLDIKYPITKGLSGIQSLNRH
jgi:hypothetical protein